MPQFAIVRRALCSDFMSVRTFVDASESDCQLYRTPFPRLGGHLEDSSFSELALNHAWHELIRINTVRHAHVAVHLLGI